MNKFEASEILKRCGMPPGVGFHTLSSSRVDALLREADRLKYRAPKNANGSRARYFYAFVCRVAGRVD